MIGKRDIGGRKHWGPNPSSHFCSDYRGLESNAVIDVFYLEIRLNAFYVVVDRLDPGLTIELANYLFTKGTRILKLKIWTWPVRRAVFFSDFLFSFLVIGMVQFDFFRFKGFWALWKLSVNAELRRAFSVSDLAKYGVG